MFKKFLAITLAATMAISMVGCSGDESSDKNGTTTVTVGEGEVLLPEYKGLVVYADDVACTDDEYKAVKQSFLSSCSTTELETTGTIKEDSVVNVDYVGEIEVNGEMVAFEGGSSTSAIDIDIANDKGGYFDGFVDALIGHEAGEEFTAHLQFPETYGGSTTVNGESIALAGMDVDFTFTVHGIQKTITPKFTDELVKENSGMADVTTKKEFEEYVRNSYRSNHIIEKVWAAYVETCEIKTYDDEIVKEVETYMESYISNSYGASVSDYLAACNMTEDQYHDQVILPEAKNRMVILAIAEQEKLTISEDEYQEEVSSMAAQYNYDVETYESYSGGREYLELSLTAKRVQEFIVENVEEKEGTEPTTAAAETTVAETTAE